MLIDLCAKYLNTTLVMNDESPSSTACRTVYTILFGEYLLHLADYRAHDKKIAQGESVTEIDCTR